MKNGNKPIIGTKKNKESILEYSFFMRPYCSGEPKSPLGLKKRIINNTHRAIASL